MTFVIIYRPLPLLAIGIMISERDNKCGPFLDQWIF